MKRFTKIAVGFLALTTAQISFAATSNWSQTSLAPNVYAAGFTNSNFFTTPSSVPTRSTITTVSWNIGLYNNGATTQTFNVCYTPRYSSTPSQCLDVSGTLNGVTNAFSGQDAKGSFRISGILTGGTYPVYPSHYNMIRVDYQY
ncbi:flagellar protein FlhE [Photorhabdus antumapuensis]|uniref:flagellar protein FlhE n=1 Tax=Photorhabdus antumapuensis TaxID=2862867 RepID=UPI001CED9171|nr:flagellar protein FlhE [Photorhabdus antumapuensis]MCA6220658.1 flagellar protein FlhE [Photorhabdus antumapuensis]